MTASSLLCLEHSAAEKDGLAIKSGDTVLFHTDHHRRTYGTPDIASGWPGFSASVARRFGEMKIAAFGVESLGPGIPRVSNRKVHQICGEMGYTQNENLVNLHLPVGKGRFKFIAFPLKIRVGTGSPVRAVAVLDDE